MHQKLFTSQAFLFISAALTAILSSNWKNNNTVLMVSKIQTSKLNNPTAISFEGPFLVRLELTSVIVSIYLFIYLLMNVYTGYSLAVKDTIYFICNKIHWYH